METKQNTTNKLGIAGGHNQQVGAIGDRKRSAEYRLDVGHISRSRQRRRESAEEKKNNAIT